MPLRRCDHLSLFNFIHNVYRREGSQARSTASGSGPDLAGVLGFESHPSHYYGFFCLLFVTGNISSKLIIYGELNKKMHWDFFIYRPVHLPWKLQKKSKEVKNFFVKKSEESPDNLMTGLDFFGSYLSLTFTKLHYFPYLQCILIDVRSLMKNIAKNVILFF